MDYLNIGDHIYEVDFESNSIIKHTIVAREGRYLEGSALYGGGNHFVELDETFSYHVESGFEIEHNEIDAANLFYTMYFSSYDDAEIELREYNKNEQTRLRNQTD